MNDKKENTNSSNKEVKDTKENDDFKFETDFKFEEKNKADKNKDLKDNDNNTEVKAVKKEGGLKKLLKSRKAKHGSIAIMIVALVIAATIILNIVCSLLVDRFPALALDLTSNQVFALQEDTTDYIDHLEKDVNIYVLTSKDSFTSNGDYFVQADKMLSQMDSMSDHVHVEYIDLNQNPTFTSKYTNADWTTKDNVMIVECGSDYRVLKLTDCFEYDEQTYSYYGTYNFTGSKVEQQIVTSMLNVTTDDKAIVDFITGGQEQDYSSISSLLQSNAYQINELNLATSELDADAKVAVLFAPAVDLDDTAIAKLEDWLSNGGDNGKSLIYVANYEVEDTPNLDAFLKKWGMSMENGIVYDTDTNYLVTQNPYVSLTKYNGVYTDGLKNSSIPCLASYTRGVKVEDDSIAKAMLTSSSAAGIYPYSEKQNSSWDYKAGITGEPVNIAAVGTQSNTEEVASNVVVFGSYNMFSQAVLSYNSYNNSAYFMNVVNTLANRDDLGITIEGKTIDSGSLGADVAVQNLLMVLFVIIIPLGTLITGLVIWLRRRNR